ncbi:MAG: hypothetical protein IPI35_01805 [Deltaproteobacteria bacterium]|nr:hypothetical protein [Deltaproteobacteria bacterium]
MWAPGTRCAIGPRRSRRTSSAFEETPFTRHGRLGLSAARAYDRELLSEGQLAELLVLDRVEVRELLDAYLGDVDEEL